MWVLKSDRSNADPREGHDETASRALWGIAGPPSLPGTVPRKQVNVVKWKRESILFSHLARCPLNILHCIEGLERTFS